MTRRRDAPSSRGASDSPPTRGRRAAREGLDDLSSNLLDVARGSPARAERHGLTEFALTRVGPPT